MATGDLSTLNSVMKIVYGGIHKQYEDKPLLYNKIAKGSGTKISDKGYEMVAIMDGNFNHGLTIDGGNMPVGGSPVPKTAKVFFKNQIHAFQLTGGAIDSISNKDVGFINNVLKWTMDSTVNGYHKMGNCYAWGTGSGRLATISTGATSATQTVSNNDANRFLHDGMLVEITDGTTSRGTATITVANASSTTFTMSASLASTTSDIVVIGGGYNLAPTGMQQMVDDTTNGSVIFQNISRNTYLKYRATRVNASSVALDPSHLRRAFSAGVHISAGELNRSNLELWSHPAQTAAYNAQGWNLKRWSGSDTKLDFGYKTQEYEGIKWVEDVDAPKDKVFALDFSTFKKFVAKDPAWDEKSGAILRQVTSATAGFNYVDQYVGYLVGRYNFGCTKPNANAFVDSLAIPTGF